MSGHPAASVAAPRVTVSPRDALRRVRRCHAFKRGDEDLGEREANERAAANRYERQVADARAAAVRDVQRAARCSLSRKSSGSAQQVMGQSASREMEAL